ncbi:MAG: hypothetical protein ACPG5W_05555 [Flavobacteriales bacterium]
MFEFNRNYQQGVIQLGLAMRSFVFMPKILLIISALVFCINSSQGQELKLMNTVEGEFDFMTTDHIGRLYLAKGHELFLYSPEGELMYQFSDLSRGEITHLDCANPLKLLLFYPDYSQVTFLDNTLSRTRENVDLNTLELELAQLACASFDNGFWVYDPISFRLIRFDQSLRITNEVSNINQLVGAEINPVQMMESESWLYMNDPAHGIFVFDSFGTYSKLIPIPNAQRFQARSNGVFFLLDGKVMKYNTVSLETTEIELPETDFKTVSIEKKHLFILTEEGVNIYTITG